MAWVKQITAGDPHVCDPPNGVGWFGRLKFGFGSIWQCDHCHRFWRFSAGSETPYWRPTSIDTSKLPPSGISPPVRSARE